MKKLGLLIVLLGIGAVVALFFKLTPYYVLLTQKMDISPIKAAAGLGGPRLVNGKVNILVLGIGGGEHEGPNLSDSISVISYDKEAHTIRTLGIPRDIWSEPLQEKINAAYAIGESIDSGKGITLAKAEISSLMGIPISYGVVIDFAGFRDIVEFFDGIDVNVEQGFSDPEFPIVGRENDECGGDDPDFACRYETVTFEQGVEHMNGERALTFIRSRYANGDEGNDFARSKRQQMVIASLRQEILDPTFIGDTRRIEKLYALMDTIVKRDMDNQEAAVLAKWITLEKDPVQQSASIPESLFEIPSVYEFGRYVLLPKDGTGVAIRHYSQKALAISTLNKTK